jgi:hypothetical protein
MNEILNSTDLAHFVSKNRSSGVSMQKNDLSSLPSLTRSEILELGSTLAYDETLAALRPKNKNFVWHVAMQKSGCTWVTQVLSEGLKQRGWDTINLIPMARRREQEVSPIELLRQKKLENDIFAIQQHCMYSEYAVSFIKRFNVKPLLQVRNIADCIVSTIDHINNESVEFPFAYLNKEQWLSFSEEQQLQFIMDFIVPWYIKFWVSWTTGLKQHNIAYQVISYEQLIHDPQSEFLNIANYFDSAISPLDIKNWLEMSQQRPTRKNKAVVGRGNSLPMWVHDKLRRLTDFYPHVDFTPLGIIKN